MADDRGPEPLPDPAPTAGGGARPSPDRPVDPTPIRTVDLPATPRRDRTIPATAWVEAPASLLALGDRYGGPRGHDPAAVSGTAPSFLRRIGPWLLWRAGPPRGADACHWAFRVDRLDEPVTFVLRPDGTGEGRGPTGTVHTRFRTWKEDLRDRE